MLIYKCIVDALISGQKVVVSKYVLYVYKNKFRGVNRAFKRVVEVDMDPHVASHLHGLNIQCQDLI